MRLTRFKAALDAAGKLTAWRVRDAGHSIMAGVRPEEIKEGVDRHALGGIVDMPYEVPNLKIEFAMRNSHGPVGFIRTGFHSQNPFIPGGFLHEPGPPPTQAPLSFSPP